MSAHLPPNWETHYEGQGCRCGAYASFECGCGVDWTNPEIYKLRHELAEARKTCAKDQEQIKRLEIELAAIGEIAVVDWDDQTVGKVDQVLDKPVGVYRDELRRLFVEQPERIAELERELAEARDELQTLHLNAARDAQLIESLGERAERAEKDSARLDWLQKNAPVTLYMMNGEVCAAEIAGGFDQREAIDAAMKQ